jgi:hypothetical protein
MPLLSYALCSMLYAFTERALSQLLLVARRVRYVKRFGERMDQDGMELSFRRMRESSSSLLDTRFRGTYL